MERETFPALFARYRKLILFLLIPLLSLAMHWRVFDLDLISFHSWRQTQTQTNIRNFVEEDFNILNPRRNDRGAGEGIFRMEFPVMQWIFASAYKLFGEEVIISRILSFLISLFSVWGMYFLLKYLLSSKAAGVLGAWALTFSPSFFYYAVNPMPDNFALCCGIWGVAMFLKWRENQKYEYLIFSSILLGLSTLAKLPFVLFYTFSGTYLLYQYMLKQKQPIQAFKYLMPLFLSAMPAAIWYINVIPTWGGNGIVEGILELSQSPLEILDILQHNLLSTLPELLVNYAALAFFLTGFYFFFNNRLFRNSEMIPLLSWGLFTILYFFFEMNMIAKVHDYYLFPFLPLIFIAVVYGALQWFKSTRKFIRIGAVILLMILPLTAHLRMANRWNPKSPGFNKDFLVYKDTLRNAVPDDALIVTGNDRSHYIYFYYLDKKGWGFHEDNLSANELELMINEGAEYLYSDSRKIDEKAAIQPYLDSLLLEVGSIRLYSLKK